MGLWRQMPRVRAARLGRAATGLLMRHYSTSRLAALYCLLFHQSHLVSYGWFRSFFARLAVNANGEPVPWWTYSAVQFLEPRITPNFRVFEFGGGCSTVWWAQRVDRVVCCEPAVEWRAFVNEWTDRVGVVNKVRWALPEAPVAAAYAGTLLLTAARFDIIVIDGQHRTECARIAADRLAPDGVIVWDDTNRPGFNKGTGSLLRMGFRRLDFSGLGPVYTVPWRTTIFYRPDNCLGI